MTNAKLKQLIKDRGLKVSFIAEQVGMSYHHLIKVLNNDVTLTAEVEKKVLKAIA